MMFDEDCEPGTFLMPLKKKKTARERNKQCLTWAYDDNQKCQEMKRTECDRDDADDVDERADPPPARDEAEPQHGRAKFKNSVEWKWTKCTCAGLFRIMGEYYDEMWFATAIKEWCLLYYRCNHTADYWQYKDEWISGDEEVRMAVWNEILKQRDRADRRREECQKLKGQEFAEGKSADPDARRIMEMYGVDTEEDAYRVREMHGAVDEASELVVLKRMDVRDENRSPEIAPRDVANAKTVESELLLANPETDPDWVEMRRRMRGSFAALNMCRCDVSFELLNHIMIELCKYWANLPNIEHKIDPIMERNITREIQNFRFKLFDMTPEECEELKITEPQSSERTQPSFQERTQPQSSERTQPSFQDRTQPQSSERTQPPFQERTQPPFQERTQPPCREETDPSCQTETDPPRREEPRPPFQENDVDPYLLPPTNNESDNYCGYVEPQYATQDFDLDESTPKRGRNRNRV
ncbi:Hypothetical protein CINCED_3A011986 [Cinara cedri]|uniref:Uncharacterized protein n=1 Tax=Cinara cedri TaxID=506608 RepID=A0A5E4N9Z8_9HEMI|nr:Hypothetical protein CINCED_3A011986 [Cinara cedri]